jgi:transposase-like protein
MTRTHYTPEQKAAALARLRANMGDLTLTSQQLSIPPRTLRDWRQHYHAFKSLVNTSPAASEPVDPPPPSTINPPPLSAEVAANEFEQLRTQLMTQIMELTADFPDSMESATMRASAISRLLTWVFKLDEIIPAMRPKGEFVYRVEYKHPDGNIRNYPPWQRPKPDDPVET